MPVSLSVGSAIEKNKIASNNAYLIFIDVDIVDPTTLLTVETLHMVRDSQGQTFNENFYGPTPFEIELKQDQGSQPTINLRIKDYSRAIQARMQAYGGGVGFKVTVSIAHSDVLDQPADVVQYFEVIGASCAAYEVNWILGTSVMTMQTFPRRTQTRDYCQWRFKDPDTCAYAGTALTCDLTLNGNNGCAVKHNSVNFGGFPGLNASGVSYY